MFITSPLLSRRLKRSWEARVGLIALVACLGASSCKSSATEQKDVIAEREQGTEVTTVRQETPPNVLFQRGTAPVLTGWELTSDKLLSEYCLACHTKSHEEWQQGMHSQAWTSAIFQRAYEFEKHDWCVHCHAPLRQDMQGDEPWADEGVNCATCHVREGSILGLRTVHASGPEGHDVVATPYLGTSEFCAECHQFNFPKSFANTVSYSHQPMQNTYAEWQRSGQARCQECHYSGHQLMGPHNAEWMRHQFADFRSEPVDAELLHLSFSVAQRGHRTPTGDLFRSLVFRLARDEGLEEILYEKRWGRFFGTGWIASNEISTHALKRNSGLMPEEMRVSLTLDTPATGPLYGALIFYYHDPFFAGKGKGRDEGSSLTLWVDKLR
jgi:hypothetical protein